MRKSSDLPACLTGLLIAAVGLIAAGLPAPGAAGEAANEQAPLEYRGFPVYPPKAQPTRSELFDAAKQRSRAHGRASGASPREADRPSRTDQIDCLSIALPMRTSQGHANAEHDLAVATINRRASESGWTQVHEADLCGSGSLTMEWARMDRELTTVTVFSPKGRCSRKYQGWMHYRICSGPRPYEHNGFPLCSAQTRADGLERRQVALGTELSVEAAACDAAWASEAQDALPALAGWRLRRAPGLGRNQLWEKDGRLVIAEMAQGWRRIRFTFVEAGKRDAVLEMYPEQETLELELTRCLLFLDGRYLRPPYRLRLEGDWLTVNGVHLEQLSTARVGVMQWRWPDFIRGLEIQRGMLDDKVTFLLTVQTATGPAVTRRSSQLRRVDGLHGILQSMDQIVRSDKSRFERRRDLRILAADAGMGRLESDDPFIEALLDHWDGID